MFLFQKITLLHIEIALAVFCLIGIIVAWVAMKRLRRNFDLQNQILAYLQTRDDWVYEGNLLRVIYGYDSWHGGGRRWRKHRNELRAVFRHMIDLEIIQGAVENDGHWLIARPHVPDTPYMYDRFQVRL